MVLVQPDLPEAVDPLGEYVFGLVTAGAMEAGRGASDSCSLWTSPCLRLLLASRSGTNSQAPPRTDAGLELDAGGKTRAW
jgi:hypothetical protein